MDTKDILGDYATLKGLITGTLESFEDSSVTKINKFKFANNTGLKTVRFNSVTEICERAFYGTGIINAYFPNLTTFTPSGNSSNSYYFGSCNNLVTIEIPKCKTFGDNTFYGCGNLEYVIDNEEFTIGSNTFYNCTKLIGIKKSNGEYNKNLYRIDYNGLYNTGITELHLTGYSHGGSSKWIHMSSNALAECKKLEKIRLSGTVTIDTKCFLNDTLLKTVIIDFEYTTAGTLSKVDAFSGCSSLESIYVPDTMVDLYKSATNWSTYANKIKPLSELPAEDDVSY